MRHSMNQRSLIAAFLFVVLALGVSSASAEEGAPPAPRISFVTNSQGVRGALLKMYLKTSVERAWDAVSDPNGAPQILDGVVAVKRQPDGLWEYRLESPLGDKYIYCKVTIKADRHYIHWKRIRGNLEHVEGYFKISQTAQYPDYAFVDYGSYIDPGGIGRILMTNNKREQSINRMIGRLRRLVAER